MDSDTRQILSIELSWEPVLTRNDEPYRYPLDLSSLKENAKRPAVYRWSFFRPGTERPEYLVGETGSLYHRLQAYLRGQGKHAPDMNQCHKSGGEVRLDLLHFGNLKINGVLFSAETLKRAFVRGTLENLCCAALQDEGFLVHNQLWEE